MHNSNQISLHKEEFSLPPSSYHQREVNKSGAVHWEKTLMTDVLEKHTAADGNL